MSHYLIDELERYGVAVRDRSEVAAPARRGRPARRGHPHRRDAAAALLPLPLPRRLPLHRVARRHGRPRREGVHPHRPRSRSRRPARDQRARRLRRRRRPRRLDQALRDRGRRGRDGRPLRPRAPLARRRIARPPLQPAESCLARRRIALPLVRWTKARIIGGIRRSAFAASSHSSSKEILVPPSGSSSSR